MALPAGGIQSVMRIGCEPPYSGFLLIWFTRPKASRNTPTRTCLGLQPMRIKLAANRFKTRS
jgi:hypothetical protein